MYRPLQAMALLTLSAVACVADPEDTIGPTVGVLRVTVRTVGVDPDPDGFILSVGNRSVPLESGRTVRVTDLTPGPDRLELTGLAANCTAAANPREVLVRAGAEVPVDFDVACTATTGSVEVSVVTSGIDVDLDGYDILLDGNPAASVPIVGSRYLEGLTAADYAIGLTGVRDNCAVDGENPRSATVRTGGLARDTARIRFEVTCGAVAGIILVEVRTSGGLPDPNGYLVELETQAPQRTGPAGDLTFVVVGGDYVIRLGDLSDNCVVTGDNPRTLTVTTGGPVRDVVRTRFDVSCPAPIIQITAVTTGDDPDPNGYRVGIGCWDYYYYYYCDQRVQVPANGSVQVAARRTGLQAVLVEDLAPNCTVLGQNPREITVVAPITEVLLEVTCFALGVIEITTTTTGVDLDGDGYVVGPAAGSAPTASLQVPVNGTRVLTGMFPGTYRLEIRDLSINCDLASPSPVDLTVPSGGTVEVRFTVMCEAASTLAFVRDGEVFSMRSNGSDLRQLTFNAAEDAEPAWSPDGTRIAFVSTRDGRRALYLMNADGSAQTPLTDLQGTVEGPTWSPDGASLAFGLVPSGSQTSSIWRINVDQTGLRQLTPAGRAPSWSPDGSRIAFQRDGCAPWTCISVINASDGSALSDLTTGSQDRAPAWSPDGTRIAFFREECCDYYYYYYYYSYIRVMNSTGGGITAFRLGYDPAWSPDGNWIAFTDGGELWAARLGDGRLVQLLPGAGQPAWRR